MPREAQRLPAGELLGDVATAVIDEREVGVVRPRPVGLDDQPQLGPDEVRGVAPLAVIDERWRQAGLGGEREEALLEFAARDLRRREGEGVDGGAQPARAGIRHVEDLQVRGGWTRRLSRWSSSRGVRSIAVRAKVVIRTPISG